MRYLIFTLSFLSFNLLLAQSTVSAVRIIPPTDISINCGTSIDDLRKTGRPMITNSMLAGSISYTDEFLESTNCSESRILRTFRATTVHNEIIEAEQVILLKYSLEDIAFPADFCTTDRMSLAEMSPEDLAINCSMNKPESACSSVRMVYDDQIVQSGTEDYKIYRTWSAYVPCEEQQKRSHIQVLQAKNSNINTAEKLSLHEMEEKGDFLLYQNQPNPATNSTAIGFVLPINSSVKLFISNELGQSWLVHTDSYYTGRNEIEVDLSDFPAGWYTYTLIADKYIASKKMILTR